MSRNQLCAAPVCWMGGPGSVTHPCAARFGRDAAATWISQQRIQLPVYFEAAPLGVLLQQQIVAISLPAEHSAAGRRRERF